MEKKRERDQRGALFGTRVGLLNLNEVVKELVIGERWADKWAML